MSLLDPITPAAPVLSDTDIARIRARHIQVTAQQLRALPATEFAVLFAAFSGGVSQIWDDPNPADILAALGTDATALFDLSAKTVTFLELLKPGCTSAVTAKIKPTTSHDDGTVTLV